MVFNWGEIELGTCVLITSTGSELHSYLLLFFICFEQSLAPNVCFSAAVREHWEQKPLWRRKGFLPVYAPTDGSSLREGRPAIWRSAACWLLTLFYPAQAQLPRVGATHSGLGLPTPITNQDNPSQTGRGGGAPPHTGQTNVGGPTVKPSQLT